MISLLLLILKLIFIMLILWKILWDYDLVKSPREIVQWVKKIQKKREVSVLRGFAYDVLMCSIPVRKILSRYPRYRLVDPEGPQCSRPRKAKIETSHLIGQGGNNGDKNNKPRI